MSIDAIKQSGQSDVPNIMAEAISIIDNLVNKSASVMDLGKAHMKAKRFLLETNIEKVNFKNASEYFIDDLKAAMDRFLRDYGASNEIIEKAIDYVLPELCCEYHVFKTDPRIDESPQKQLTDEEISKLAEKEYLIDTTGLKREGFIKGYKAAIS